MAPFLNFVNRYDNACHVINITLKFNDCHFYSSHSIQGSRETKSKVATARGRKKRETLVRSENYRRVIRKTVVMV